MRDLSVGWGVEKRKQSGEGGTDVYKEKVDEEVLVVRSEEEGGGLDGVEFEEGGREVGECFSAVGGRSGRGEKMDVLD